METTQTTTPTTVGTNDFTTALQNKLLASSDMISSSNTGIESAIQGAIDQTKTATEKSSQAIGLNYDRQIADTQGVLNGQLTAQREVGAGNSNTATTSYQFMATQADKQIKDLDQRKQELILQNDAAGAAKVSDLMLKTLEMKNQAMQQTFGNLLSLGTYSNQVQQQQLAVNSQNFQQKSAIASIGLQYGIPVTANDTIETVVAKAAPLATQKQKADLALTMANINKVNAEAAKAVKEGASDALLNNISNPANLAVATQAFLNDGTGLFKTSLAKNPQAFATVSANAAKTQSDAASAALESYKAQGLSKTAAIAQFNTDFPINSREDGTALAKLIAGYTAPTSSSSKTSTSYSDYQKALSNGTSTADFLRSVNTASFYGAN